MQRGRGIPSFIIIVLIVIFLAIVVMERNTTQEVTYSGLMQSITKGEVEEIVLSSDGSKAAVTYKKDEGSKKQVQKIVNIPSLTAFMNAVEEDIANGNIEVKEESPSTCLRHSIPYIASSLSRLRKPVILISV